MNPEFLIKTVREYGVSWAAWRAAYGLALRTGYFRRGFRRGADPVRTLVADLGGGGADGAQWLSECWQAGGGRFFLPATMAETGLPPGAVAAATTRAEAVLRGEYRIFSSPRELGSPPDWFLGEPGRAPWPADRHWSEIGDLGTDCGDIKYVWELSRFGFAWDLGRAYRLTGDDRYAEGFWRLCESWWAANSPEMGPHWRCGQEMSFRVLAWVFALHALADAPASSPARIGTLVAQLRLHGRLIERVNWYANRCVKNNHAISEAVALRTLGLVLPFVPEAARWRRRGLANLQREVAWQVLDDGTYIQQSNVYARLVVQLLTWALCQEAASGTRQSELALLKNKADLLRDQLMAQLVGGAGELPNYGSNDGTLLLPWSDCGYRDFRPALHALGLALGQAGLSGAGPWREEACWFGLGGGLDAAQTPAVAPQVRSFNAGGLCVLRQDDSMVLFRCGPNAHRPAEADMLHVDYWCHGRNLLLDAGTLGYNLPRRLRDYFAGTGSHNTITVDGADQMRRGDRFLWHDWVQGQISETQAAADESVVAGRHTGYRPAVHERSVHLRSQALLVVDTIGRTTAVADLRLHWLVADAGCRDAAGGVVFTGAEGQEWVVRVWCDQPAEYDIVRDSPDQPRGVWSPNYGELRPACSLAVTARAVLARFVTFVGPAAVLAGLAIPAGPSADQTVESVLTAWRRLNPQSDGKQPA